MLFLGEWCLLFSRRHIWQGLGPALPHSWTNIEQTGPARSYIAALYEDLLVRLGAALNEVHGIPHSTRYWRIVAGPWLYYYLCAVYERYLSLSRAFEADPSATTIVLDDACFSTPGDTTEFVEWLKSDVYNLQIYSRLLKEMGREFPVKSLAPERRLSRAEQAPSPESRFARALYSIFGGRGKVVLCDSYFPKRVVMRFALETMGKVIPVRSITAGGGKGALDKACRGALGAALPARDAFEAAVAAMIGDDIPTCLLEDYVAIGAAARRHFPAEPKAILSATWAEDEPLKRWAAESQEHGTKLLVSQHGGGYGILRYFPWEDHEMGVVDRYYSWGWSSSRHPDKTIPMPAGKFMGRKSFGADNRKNGILWVATEWPRYPLFPMNLRFPEYLDWQARFLSAFPARLRGELRFRPHREDGGWEIIERLRDLRIPFRIESWSAPFDQSLAESRLYVCDHLSTTFIDALVADKPTVLFWSPESNQLRPDAVPCMEALKAAGILFESPEAAAAAVDAAYDDVEGWWGDPRRREARRIFCRSHGRSSPAAHSEWTQELSALLNG